jgi:flavin reductase (DIM6/NTAB) family NADH-FMN oxidoreductase RutF
MSENYILLYFILKFSQTEYTVFYSIYHTCNYLFIRIFPFITALIGAKVNGKPNYTAVGAYGVVSMKPVLYTSLKTTHYTTLGIKQNGYFSINIPSSDIIDKTDYCGIVSGNVKSKSNIFTAFYDKAGDAPMISECNINYLCKVIRTIPIFDFEMFLGEITAVYVNKRCLTDNKIDLVKINPTVLMDNFYCDIGKKIGEVFNLGNDLKTI